MSSFYVTTLYPLQDKVLRDIDKLDTEFYLTGGTALSRGYFGHRYSDDLDLFMNANPRFMEYAEIISNVLAKKYSIEAIIKSPSYYSLKIDKVLKLDMVNDVAKQVDKPKPLPLFSRTDNLDNILANKISAIVSRDEPKDIVDIWIMNKNMSIKWRQVFDQVDSKAVGIFPPAVAERIATFPIELLSRINWVENKEPKVEDFKKDLDQIVKNILRG